MSKKNRLKAVDLTEAKERPSIVVTGEFLSNKTIFHAFQVLMQGDYTHDVAFQLEKVARRLNQFQKTFEDRSKAIIDKYAVLDENGLPKKKMEPKILSNGEIEMAPKKLPDGTIEKDANGAPIMTEVMVPVDFEWKMIDEKNDLGEDITTPGNELAEIEFMKLGEEEYTMDVYKFNRNDFADARLKVAQWMSINPLFENPYVTEDEEVQE